MKALRKALTKGSSKQRPRKEMWMTPSESSSDSEAENEYPHREEDRHAFVPLYPHSDYQRTRCPTARWMQIVTWTIWRERVGVIIKSC